MRDWYDANQRYLMARLSAVREMLERHVSAKGSRAESHDCESLQRELEAALAEMPSRPALDSLCAAFGLSPFERDLLLLCAGVELDSDFRRLCAEANHDQGGAFATFSLALAVLPEAHWSAITPTSPLRRWRMIEVGVGTSLTSSQLTVDERVLHHLTGLSYLDARLQGLLEAVPPPACLPPSHEELSFQIVDTVMRSKDNAPACLFNLCGGDSAGKRAVAALACANLGIRLNLVVAADLPQGFGDREALARLWEREAALASGALMVDFDESENGRVVRSFVQNINGLLFVASREPLHLSAREAVRLDVNRPPPREQRKLWEKALGPEAQRLNGQLERVAFQFSLGTGAIQSVGAQLLGTGTPEDGEQAGRLLWDACRIRARSRLDDLAERIEPIASWDDLILPEQQLRILRDVTDQVSRRATVYDTWGFGAKGARGLGISALFAGASGTGKTMAAEVIANNLSLDLYRIDLSQVVSKYIGETEKNLRRVFDAAEEGGAVLLFDEADALFGKRTEVKDSHDRYANIEISYLLQRMESYRGLAILTTNMKNVLDGAFLRRIRFVVQFPFPDSSQRTRIWRAIFPENTPTAGLDFNKLARLNVAGGNIRNIALQAAFLAARDQEPVRMAHLLQAARTEYAKLEKTLTETESRDWL